MRLVNSCTGVKNGDPNIFKRLFAVNVDEILKRLCNRKEKLCNNVETIREFTYLGDKERASGRCDADVTAKTEFCLSRLENVTSHYIE